MSYSFCRGSGRYVLGFSKGLQKEHTKICFEEVNN